MHFFRREHQALQLRSWASRFGLSAGTLVLLATSAPPRWTVETSAEAPFAQGPAGTYVHRVAPVVLRVDTPTGLWPVGLGASYSNGFTQVSLVLQDSRSPGVDVTLRDSCTGCSQVSIEVACRERHCTVDIPITLDAQQAPAYPRDGSITVSAGTGGGPRGGGACSDQTKESSTETESAPLGLQLKLTIGEFEDVPWPDGEWLDSGTMPPMTIDGGPSDGGTVDAGERDASHQDGGAVRDAEVDARALGDAATEAAGTGTVRSTDAGSSAQ